jgi:hypothetical protein
MVGIVTRNRRLVVADVRWLTARRMLSSATSSSLPHLLGEEPQHQIAVLLQHVIFAAIASIGDRIGEVLSPIKFHCDARIGAEQINFQPSETIERDRQIGNEAEAVSRLR